MPLSIFKNAKGAAKQIDFVEAHNIWLTIYLRQTSVLNHQFLANYVHDNDFLLLINQHINQFQSEIKTMEEMATQYKVKASSKPPVNLKFTTQINQITDQMIYDLIYAEMIAELYTLARAVKATTTNDNLRQVFADQMISHLRLFQVFYQYGSTKGWLGVAPAYKTEKPVKKEQLSIGEAANLWDILTQRYDQIQLTQFYLSFVHDDEFLVLLNAGLATLQSQAEALENYCMKFEVPLAYRPPSHQQATIDPETMEDRFVYRQVLTGVQGAIELHMRSLIESVRNDELRKFFLELTQKELTIFSNLLKYGKAKGWAKIVPIYKPT